jgi:hypothetical protein
MKMSILGLFLGLLCVSSVFAQKQNFVERVYEGSSSEKNSVQARKEIMDEATEKISETLIKEIVGEAKYLRNKALVTRKILKNSARYIPFSRPGDLIPVGEGFKMAVSMKISMDDLQSMLLENGLFYKSDGTPTVIPMVRWSDRVRMQSWSWWKEPEEFAKAFLIKQNKSLETSLRAAFLKVQFYSMRPASLKYSQILLPAFLSDHWSADDLQSVSQKLGVQILVDGEITFVKSQERSEAVVIHIKMSATQVQNGRSIAEVSRQMETEPGPFESTVDKKLRDGLDQASVDLATQVFEAWSHGTIGSSLYKLMLRGRLPIVRQEAFKEIFRSKVREIKNIRERLVSPDSIIFEVDSLAGPSEIAKKIPSFEIGEPGSRWKIVLDSSSESELVYKIVKGN